MGIAFSILHVEFPCQVSIAPSSSMTTAANIPPVAKFSSVFPVLAWSHKAVAASRLACFSSSSLTGTLDPAQ
jgi:hypothetical protein